MNIAEILRRQAEQFPDQLAIVDRVGREVRKWTFAELDEAIGRMATMLRRAGLSAGETVLIFQPMSAELYIALAAVLRAGMTAMFVDPSAGRGHIDRCCDLLPPSGLVANSRAHLLRLCSPALRRIPLKWSVGGGVPFTSRMEQLRQCSNDGIVDACGAEAPALASFTSGSTGQPKAAVRTHGFLLAQYRAVAQSLKLTPGEVELVTMPIFVLANLASRVTSVIADADLRRVGEIDPGPVIRQIHEHGVDRFAASPSFFEKLVEGCERSGIQFDSVRKIFTGGGPVAPWLLDRLQKVAPRSEITVVYGSTEAEPISTVARGEIDTQDAAAISGGRGLLVGKPVPSIDVRIICDRWGESLGQLTRREFEGLCRPSNEPGEIVVSGTHVLDDYLHGQGADENKFCVDRTRWHRTGDAGYFDDRGRLWLLGRCAARLDDGYGALYPLGVEQAALRNPSIGKAAIVSHRDQRVLVVTLRDSEARPDCNALLKSLAFANVDSIRIVKRLPVDRRHQSKIDYSSLRKLLES
jgi:acyl-CoA synthetase (AMP-forming)/AMP-acid ligase II